MPSTRTEIANLALGHLGQYRITDIDEQSPPAVAVRDAWAMARDAVLRAHHWNFATTPVVLSQLATAPAFGWAYQWQLPADFLKLVSVNGVFSGTRDTEFTIRGNLLLTNEQKAEVEYVRCVTECELWDSQFVMLFGLELAQLIAPRLTLSGGNALAERAERAGLLATHSDAIDSRPHVIRAETNSRYQMARFGLDPDIG